MGHGPHSSQLVVLFYVLFVCKRVLYYCHRVSTQLQLTNVPYYTSKYVVYVYVVLKLCRGSKRLENPFLGYDIAGVIS